MRRRDLILAVVLASVAAAGCKHPFVNSGNIYVDQNLLPKAEYCYRYAIDEEPDNAEAHFQLGFTLSEMAKQHLAEGQMDSAQVKFAEATEHYLEAAELDSVTYYDDADLNIGSNFARVFNDGSRLVRADRTDEALEFYNLAYLIDPRGDNGAKARLNVIQLEYTSLRETFTEARSNDDEATLEKTKAQLGGLLAMIDESLPNVTDPTNRRTYNEVKAAIYRMLDQDDKARQIYADMLAEDPEDINLILNLARSQGDQKEYSAAAEFYDNAIDLIESAPLLNEDGRYNYLYGESGAAHFNASEYELAIPKFEMALDLSQIDAERLTILYNIATSYWELEEFQKAVDYAQQVTELAPDYTNAWRIQCRALNRLERTDEATDACNRYEELRGTS